MRILRVAQKVYPDVKGGGPYHVHAISRDQAEMGHDVTVLTVSDDDSKPRREERDGYTVVRRKPTVELLGNEISVGVAKFLAQADDYDVIHAHSHLYFSTNLAALKRRLGDTPLAITNHGLYSQTAPEWVFDMYLRTLGRWTFDSADVVFCYTETDKLRIQDLGVGSQIKVVQNGIDTERFRPEGPGSDLIRSEGSVVLFVGRLVEGKRPKDAVSAIPEVQKEYPDAELYLCGDGPLRSELEELADELGISESVHFLGHLRYDEMPKVYRSGDVLVLPSRTEGLPRTVLEAMASGVPVVCSRLDQLRGLVDRRGTLVNTKTEGSLAQGIADWLKADITTPLGDEYMWETTVKGTTATLQSLLE